MKNQTVVTEDLKKIIAENYSKFKKTVKRNFIFDIATLTLFVSIIAYYCRELFRPLVLSETVTMFNTFFVLTFFQIFIVCFCRRNSYKITIKKEIKKSLQVKLSYGEFKALEKSGEAERWASEYEAHEAAMMPTYKKAFAAEYEMYKKSVKIAYIVEAVFLSIMLILAVYLAFNAFKTYADGIDKFFFYMACAAVAFCGILILYMPVYLFKKITDRFSYIEFRKMEKSGEMAKLVAELNCKNDISEIAEDTANVCAVETAPSDIEDTADTDGGEGGIEGKI